MDIYHVHHIIPRHAGGTDHPDNLVKLTIPEHAEAHRLLYEQHNRWQDFIAWKMLSGQIDNAEAIRMAQSLANKGKTITDQHKEQNSIATKKQWADGRGVLNQDKMKQATMTKYGVDNIRKTKTTCPHCDKIGQATAFKRWHFDNCKLKPSE